MTAGVLAAVRNLELVVQLLPPPSLLEELMPGRPLAVCADALTRGLLDERLNEIVRGAYCCVWARVVLQSSLGSAEGWPTVWDSLAGASAEQAGLYSALAQLEVEELRVVGGLLGTYNTPSFLPSFVASLLARFVLLRLQHVAVWLAGLQVRCLTVRRSAWTRWSRCHGGRCARLRSAR